MSSGGNISKAGNAGYNGTKLYGGTGASGTNTTSMRAFYSYAVTGCSSYINEHYFTVVETLNGNTTFATVIGTNETGNRRSGALRIIDKLVSVRINDYVCFRSTK